MSIGTRALSGAPITRESMSPGIFRRAYDRLVEAQERKAVALVSQYLAALSDEHLANLGYGPAEIKAIRERGSSVTAPRF